ncbi:MAG: peptidoglycan DD-metalloendopeptidase family protein [Anaerolineae bacterium]|nr:peptidoglycan DD-metalloendopeptidase family protein [Anaerolineae bacterium]MCI0608932.1 peptidoglycan DD-metalloendopeptidase family protein [Anaerolineae bacterium]
MPKLVSFFNSNKFNIISWFITAVLVVALIGGALIWRQSKSTPQALAPQPTVAADENPPEVKMPALGGPEAFLSIEREILIKTNVPADKPRYDIVDYRVTRGDSIFAIAESYELKPETVLWANYNVLQDDPHSLKPGQVLTIPPTDGIYYQWGENDTLDTVALEFEVETDNILNYPGNDIDLTDPKVESGSWVMIPGGKREFVVWLVPTIASGASGTSSTSQSLCPGGAVGSGGFVWPADAHSLSGNDYWSGHLGIDIAAGEGAAVYAADSGVVTMAQGGYNYGYGNVIQIDHGNGYSTVYAHLSVIGVGQCASVSAGQWIGSSGSTGNSQGAHLHFEVRQNGGFINPWFVLP